MKLSTLQSLLPEIADLTFITPPEEQGQPHKVAYATYSGPHGGLDPIIIRREFNWDEGSNYNLTNLRHEYTAYQDGDPDSSFEPWATSPELGEEIGLLGIKTQNYHNEDSLFYIGQSVTHVTDEGAMLEATISSISDGLLELTFDDDGEEGSELPYTCF